MDLGTEKYDFLPIPEDVGPEKIFLDYVNTFPSEVFLQFVRLKSVLAAVCDGGILKNPNLDLLPIKSAYASYFFLSYSILY